jgi:hypothetical protein
MERNRHSNAGWMTLTVLAVVAAALFAAPSASADDPCLPENGCVPGEVAPPLPPDQAGDPQTVTIDWVKIPDVPPYVEVPLGLPAPPKGKCAKHRAHSGSAAAKRCKRKRR